MGSRETACSPWDQYSCQEVGREMGAGLVVARAFPATQTFTSHLVPPSRWMEASSPPSGCRTTMGQPRCLLYSHPVQHQIWFGITFKLYPACCPLALWARQAPLSHLHCCLSPSWVPPQGCSPYRAPSP